MNTIEKDHAVIVQGIRDFDPVHTFDNGQCFRWNQETDGSYTGTAFGRVINIKQQDEDTLILDNTTLHEFDTIWKAYLDLERDYGVLKELFSQKDPAMQQAVAYGGGMRILKQEKWETLISFILSQNNNVTRIKKCVESVCSAHGTPIGLYRGRMYYAFPTPEQLARLSPEELDTCRLGYRAKYLVETAKQVLSDGGEALERMGQAEAQEAYDYLLGLSGVGPKVANCIMLFSMGKYASFPLDVWIKRVMHEIYHIEEGNTKKMQEYAAEHFGEYGGIAQQYLFYYARAHSNR